jgi:hypothetical protein
MRDIVETEEPEEAASVLGSEDLTPDNQADLFMPQGESSSSAASHPTNMDDLAPDPVHVFRLWQLFLDRVNPLTKIVHVPSLQPYVMEAATGMTGLPLNYQALLFAIYTMATLSLSDAECVHMLGVSRDRAIARFSAGARSALVRFNFLKNHDMAVLQALLFYLVSQKGHPFCTRDTHDIKTRHQDTTRVPLTLKEKKMLTITLSSPSKAASTATPPGSSAAPSSASPKRWATTATARSSAWPPSRRRCAAASGGRLSCRTPRTP